MSKKPERALVTGASSGIGMEIARVLAKQGCELVICARREKELQTLAEELQAKYETTVQVVTADLSSTEGVERLIDSTAEIDILVNNAGFGTIGDHIEGELEVELAMLDLNMRALTQLSHHYGKQMMAKGSGRILNVASIAALLPGPSMAVYCASKSYVLSYSRALRYELRPKGVSVTALCPGPVLTEFQRVSGLKLGSAAKMYLVSAAKVAAIAVKAMRKGRREVYPGLMNKPFPLLIRFTPVRMQLAIMNRMLK